MSRARSLMIVAASALGALGPAAAQAQRQDPAQAHTLEQFLRASRSASLDVAEQAQAVEQRAAEVDLERGALWPSLATSASYTRNQNETVVFIPRMDGPAIEATIVPADQLDLTVTLNVPLVDLAAWRRVTAASASLEAAQGTLEARTDDVERAVVRAFYQWVGNAALVRSAQVAEKAAQDNLAVVEQRASAGLASPLDVSRARAQVARARESIASAELGVATAQRTLRTLTGIEPAGEAPPLPEDIAPAAPLADWLSKVGSLPEVRAAQASQRAAQASARAESLGWLPTLSAFASERVTNAAGFGEADNWSAGVKLSWLLDRRTLARHRLGQASAQASAVRVRRAVQDARDRVTDAWNQVTAERARAEAAAAEVEAARQSAEVATTRFAGGTVTQIEVIQAQRDAFAADVSLAAARANLAAARALLRLAAGVEVAP
jgi:outer membrane protein